MDSQFNELRRSYHDNFLEYRVTGDPKYKTAYESAGEGIRTIIAGIEADVSARKKEIADFYTENTEEKLNDLRAKSRELKAGLAAEDDLLKAASMRQESVSALPSFKTHFVGLGVLGALLLGLWIL